MQQYECLEMMGYCFCEETGSAAIWWVEQLLSHQISNPKSRMEQWLISAEDSFIVMKGKEVADALWWQLANAPVGEIQRRRADIGRSIVEKLKYRK